mgnify:FL=1
MKGNLKRLIAAALACACIAPAGAVGVSAADDGGRLINLYQFEGTNWKNNSTNTKEFGTTTGGVTIEQGKIGTNDSSCVKITAPTAANVGNLTYDSTESNYLKVTAAENKYIRTDAKIYVTDDGFEGIYLGDHWSGHTPDGIKKSDLHLNAWNDVSFIATFTAPASENDLYFTIDVDMVVNGTRIGSSRWSRYSSWYKVTPTEDNKDRFFLTLYLKGTSSFVAYLDDVETRAYAGNNFSFGLKINSWGFEGATFHANDANTFWNETLGTSGVKLTAAKNIGGRSDTSARVAANGQSTYTQLNNYKPTLSATAEYPVLYDPTTNPYLMVEFDVFPQAGDDLTLALANKWGGEITPQITKDMLNAGAWNKVAILINLYDRKLDGGKLFFGIKSDIYVNGVLKSDGAPVWNHNPEVVNSDGSINEAIANRFPVTLSMRGTSYELYLDNIRVTQKYGDMKSEAGFLLDQSMIASKLVDNSKSKVEGDVVTVIEGTTVSELSANVEGVTIYATDADDELRGDDEALAAGDIVYSCSPDGSTSNSYTVAKAVQRLFANPYYVTRRSDWGVVYAQFDYETGKAKPLIATTYVVPANVYNTTGKTIKVATVFGLFEADGTLVDVMIKYTDVPASFAKTSVRLDYPISEDKLGEGRYVKAMIFDAENFRTIAYGAE